MSEASPSLRSGALELGEGHRMHWRCHGNPRGPTVLILHGGPGGAHNPRTAVFFDPALWQVVMYDQRGCGASQPYCAIEGNTLPALVADIERLRQHLGIERWALFGGSWGTRLALEYGIAHPSRCRGFLLRGVFLGRARDIDWFLWGAGRIFPHQHATLREAVRQASGRAPLDCAELLALAWPVFQSAQPRPLAEAWSAYEGAMSSVSPMPGPAGEDEMAAAAHKALSLAIIECHYMLNELPMRPAVLPRVGTLAHLPCYIVQGRYDIVCPVEQADALAAAWPGAVLEIAPMAGHWAFEPEMTALLHRAVAQLYERVA